MSQGLAVLIAGLLEQLRLAVEDVKGDPKMAKVLSLHQALNTLEEAEGAQKTSLLALFAFAQTKSIRPMEFVGLSALDAAKRYLRIKGDPGAFEEIVDSLATGGLKLSKPEQDDLRLSLARSTFEIVKQGDFYGLIEFFPHIKRGRKKKATVESGAGEDQQDSLEKETASE